MANAFFAYFDNYLIDTDHGIIMDVDASRSNKTAEVGAMRKMFDRTEERFGVKPDWIAARSRQIAAQSPAGQWIQPTGLPTLWSGWH